MLNTCVPWAQPALAALAICTVFLTQPAMTLTAQSSDPSFLPRLSSSDLRYVGGFRLPAESMNGDNFSFGGKPIAFNPAGPSLFVGSHHSRLAEVSIPALTNTGDVNAMAFASYLQGFVDPTEGKLGAVGSTGVGLSALVIQNSRLYGTASVYYDANNDQRVSHYSRSLQLNQSSFSGWSQVWDTARAGYVSGFMSNIPSVWQSRLGGSALTGQCCIPIVSRTSLGPSGFAFDVAQTGQSSISAAPLVYYTGLHPTLGAWEGTNEWYGIATGMGGVAVIAGTRTALYFGRNGMGPACYGTGTGNQSLHGSEVGDGSKYCYDPTDASKGTHAYPYRYQVWAYDLNDLAAVKAGTKQPWDVVPYDVWPINFPTYEVGVNIGGVGYDPQRQLIYVAQLGADQDTYEYRPIIHAFQVNAPLADGTLPPPPSPTTTTVTSVAISANLPAPQPVGTTVTFQAAAAGGATPRQYKWFVSPDGVNWTTTANWSTTTQFAWTPSTASQQFRVRAWARSASSTADQPEASMIVSYPIGDNGGSGGGSTISSVSLAANKSAPQLPGTSIVFSATAVGGAPPYNYKWFVYDGSQWQVRADWSSQSSFTWTPTSANAAYKVGVWMRSAGVTINSQEGSNEMPFAITSTTSAPPTAVSSVSLVANHVAPQFTGTTIVWTASATGGAAPLQYKWSVYDGITWQVVANWSTSSTYSWTPDKYNTSYQVSVGVRSAGNTADQAEASDAEPFPIVSGNPANGPIRSVTVSANRVSPQNVNTSINWKATTSTGGGALYKWSVHDGTNVVVSVDWSKSSTYSWKPTARGTYRVTVFVKYDNSTAEYDVSATETFVIR